MVISLNKTVPSPSLGENTFIKLLVVFTYCILLDYTNLKVSLIRSVNSALS